MSTSHRVTLPQDAPHSREAPMVEHAPAERTLVNLARRQGPIVASRFWPGPFFATSRVSSALSPSRSMSGRFLDPRGESANRGENFFDGKRAPNSSSQAIHRYLRKT
jgi:hypothetical protein